MVLNKMQPKFLPYKRIQIHPNTHTHTHTHTITFKILSYHTTVFYPSTDLISTRLFLYFPLILDIVIFY